MTEIMQQTIRPGFLVSLKTSVTGNVSYRRQDIEAGENYTKWETEKTTRDAAEHFKATQVRNKAVTLIRGVCSKSGYFGLLIPEAETQTLKEAYAEAQALVADFNKSARFTRVRVFVVTGKIADNDIEAARGIRAEVRGLIECMQQGIREMSPDAVRDACKRAVQLEEMLAKDNRDKLREAVKAARDAAREMVKTGEQASITLEAGSIERSRQAFIDVEDGEMPEIRDVGAASVAIDLRPEPLEGRWLNTAMMPEAVTIDLDEEEKV